MINCILLRLKSHKGMLLQMRDYAVEVPNHGGLPVLEK